MKSFILALTGFVSACGVQQGDSSQDSGTKLIDGTRWHHASGTDINVRSANLRSVLCTLKQGDQFRPTGESKVGRVSGSSYRFHEAYVPKCDVYGWIADGSWVQPGGGASQQRNVDIWHTNSYDTFYIESPDGVLNCNPGPYISSHPTRYFYNGDYAWATGVVATGPNGKPWIQVNQEDGLGSCFVRGNTKYLSVQND